MLNPLKQLGSTLSGKPGQRYMQRVGSIYQNQTKLRQTLFNLFSNAAKFTRQREITLRINRVGQNNDGLKFSVADAGVGIPLNKLDSIFEEFIQVDGSTTRNYGGTGLGLSISRRFFQLLGGKLDVHSEVGKGSTFTVRIPANL